MKYGVDAGLLLRQASLTELLSESNILEVLDSEGNPVKPGEMGEAVMTGLFRSTALHSLSYGDMVKLPTDLDKDGRGLHVIEEVVGRNTDFLIHENGSIVHALAAIYILRETGGVEQFKITQQAINKFEVLL